MATISAKELAEKLDTDARTVRRFLRNEFKANEIETPGKGSRYAIEAKAVNGLKKRFIAAQAAAANAETD